MRAAGDTYDQTHVSDLSPIPKAVCLPVAIALLLNFWPGGCRKTGQCFGACEETTFMPIG